MVMGEEWGERSESMKEIGSPKFFLAAPVFGFAWIYTREREKEGKREVKRFPAKNKL